MNASCETQLLMRKPDAGNLHVRFDEGPARLRVGLLYRFDYPLALPPTAFAPLPCRGVRSIRRARRFAGNRQLFAWFEREIEHALARDFQVGKGGADEFLVLGDHVFDPVLRAVQNQDFHVLAISILAGSVRRRKDAFTADTSRKLLSSRADWPRELRVRPGESVR